MSEKITQETIVTYPAKWGCVAKAINDSVNKAVESAITYLLHDGVLRKENDNPVRYYTRSETARMLHVNLNTIDNYVKKGKIVPIKLGGRVLFSSTEIEGIAISGLKYRRG